MTIPKWGQELQVITDMYGGKKRFALLESEIPYDGTVFTVSMYDGEAGYYQYEISCKVASPVQIDIVESRSCDGRDSIVLDGVCFDLRATPKEMALTLVRQEAAAAALRSMFQPPKRGWPVLPLLRLRVIQGVFVSGDKPKSMIFTGIPTGSFADPHEVKRYLASLETFRRLIEACERSKGSSNQAL